VGETVKPSRSEGQEPAPHPHYVTAQTVAGIHAAFEMLPFFIWRGAEYHFDNINLTKVTP
jgi:hypothetical protein